MSRPLQLSGVNEKMFKAIFQLEIGKIDRVVTNNTRLCLWQTVRTKRALN